MMRFLRLCRFVVLFLSGAALLQAQQVPDAPLPAASVQDQVVEHIGKNGVSAPILLYAPEPEFTEQARKKHIHPNVLIYFQVGTDGLTSQVRVLHGVGFGLDEEAVKAVKGYKFKPALKDGVPVRVEMNVEVNFQI